MVNPHTGVWLSEEDESLLVPDPTNPYRYVGNNPTNFTDPLGLAAQGLASSAGPAAAAPVAAEGPWEWQYVPFSGGGWAAEFMRYSAGQFTWEQYQAGAGGAADLSEIVGESNYVSCADGLAAAELPPPVNAPSAPPLPAPSGLTGGFYFGPVLPGFYPGGSVPPLLLDRELLPMPQEEELLPMPWERESLPMPQEEELLPMPWERESLPMPQEEELLPMPQALEPLPMPREQELLPMPRPEVAPPAVPPAASSTATSPYITPEQIEPYVWAVTTGIDAAVFNGIDSLHTSLGLPTPSGYGFNLSASGFGFAHGFGFSVGGVGIQGHYLRGSHEIVIAPNVQAPGPALGTPGLIGSIDLGPILDYGITRPDQLMEWFYGGEGSVSSPVGAGVHGGLLTDTQLPWNSNVQQVWAGVSLGAPGASVNTVASYTPISTTVSFNQDKLISQVLAGGYNGVVAAGQMGNKLAGPASSFLNNIKKASNLAGSVGTRLATLHIGTWFNR